jgi:hypothetical protein
MGFWTPERLAELIPQEGTFLRTRVGPVWASGAPDQWGAWKLLYAIGSAERLEAQQAAAVLNLIGAYPPRAKERGEPTDD